jgi:hypothetical protein
MEFMVSRQFGLWAGLAALVSVGDSGLCWSLGLDLFVGVRSIVIDWQVSVWVETVGALELSWSGGIDVVWSWWRGPDRRD